MKREDIKCKETNVSSVKRQQTRIFLPIYSSMDHAFKRTYFVINFFFKLSVFPLIACRFLHVLYLTGSLDDLPKYFGDVCMFI